MDMSKIIENKLFIVVISALLGSLLTIVTKYLLNKRSIFSYYVFHNRIAQSAEDKIYGSVRVTWNGSPLSNIYISAVELINSSLKDYESVFVRIFTNNTKLLTQKTYIVGTSRSIDFTKEYKNKIAVKDGNNKPTDNQLSLFTSQRDYFVPIMNRGQILRFEFINSAIPNQQPIILVDVLHKGVKCKFKVARNMIFGIPQNEAAITGTIVGLFAVILIIIFINSVPISAILSFVIGLIAVIPGAYVVKILRKIRNILAG